MVLNSVVTVSPCSRPFLQLRKRTVGDSNARKRCVVTKQSRGTNDSVDIVAFTFGIAKVYTGSSFAYSLKLSFQKVSSSWHACSVKL